MGKLSTHVLDTANGCPAAGMRVALCASTRDGRADELQSVTLERRRPRRRPLLEGASAAPGRYRLVFEVADYFRAPRRGARRAALPRRRAARFRHRRRAVDTTMCRCSSAPGATSTYRGS